MKPAPLLSRRGFRLALGIALSALFLYLAAREVDFAQAWATIVTASPRLVVLALASVAANTLAKSYRWKELLGPGGAAIPQTHLLAAILIGQSLNNLVPARAGDFSRAVIVGRLGPGGPYTLGTIVLEKILDLLAYALLLLALLAAIPIPDWVSQSAYSLAGLALLFALLVAILARRREGFIRLLARALKPLPAGISRPALAYTRTGLGSLDAIRAATLARVVAWSLVIWGTAVLTNQLTLLALEIRLPLPAPVLLLVALLAGITIPGIPGRIGLFEYICVLTLGLFGVPDDVAFGYGVLLHAIIAVPSTLTGLFAFWLLRPAGGQVEWEKV